MEVHSHTHTERKRIKHYLFEFFMLFLAVFAGFLAENQREHIVEHRRAKVYATNLYKELQKDTAELNDVTKWTQRLVLAFDSLCNMSLETPRVSNGKLYFYSGFTGWTRYFSSENSTMEQLRSSGNLRIMSTTVALKISDYDRALKNLENDYGLFKVEYETLNNLRLKIFDGAASVDLFARQKENKFRDSVFLLNPPLINDDPKLMKEFIGWVKLEGNFWRANISDHIKPLNELATELILLLKKEYHFE